MSVDGGGIRGLIPAFVLCEIERRTGRPVSETFDLMAGTSTGGIITIALNIRGVDGGPRYSTEDVLGFYENMGPRIFSKSFWRQLSSFAGYRDEKYHHAALEALLEEYLGEEMLGSSVTNMLISSYDIENRSPFFFKSWKDKFASVEMKQAARATSAAPSFFEPARVSVDGRIHTLVDGGLFANNPSLSAYIEAARIFPDDEEILLLSLGTGEYSRPISYEDVRNWGMVEWAAPVVEFILDGISDATHYHLDQLLGRNYFRFQTDIDAAFARLDMLLRTEEEVESLKDEGREILRKNEREIDRLCRMLSGD